MKPNGRIHGYPIRWHATPGPEPVLNATLWLSGRMLRWSKIIDMNRHYRCRELWLAYLRREIARATKELQMQSQRGAH